MESLALTHTGCQYLVCLSEGLAFAGPLLGEIETLHWLIR